MKENENKILLAVMGILIMLNIIFIIQLASTSKKVNDIQSDIKIIKKQQEELHNLYIYDDNELIETEYEEVE